MKKLSLIMIGLIISSSMLGFPSGPSAQSKKMFNSIAEILRTIDPAILPHTGVEPTEGNFSSGYVQVLNQKAADIRNYVAVKYREDLSNLSNIEVIVLGLGIVPFESRENVPGYKTNEELFNCFLDAIGTATLVYGLVRNFITLWNEGASVGTLLSTVKSIFKISSGWFMVGYGVYKFGGCVGWW